MQHLLTTFSPVFIIIKLQALGLDGSRFCKLLSAPSQLCSLNL